MGKYTKSAENAIENSKNLAKKLSHQYVTSAHMLYSFLTDEYAAAGEVLRNSGLDPALLYEKIRGHLPQNRKYEKIKFTPKLSAILEEINVPEIGTEHILKAVIEKGDTLTTDIFKTFHIDAAKILEMLEPILSITMSQNKVMGNLEQLTKGLKENLIGQDTAIEAVLSAFKSRKSNLGAKNRPIGSFLFVGPSGVGKTETARLLAEYLYGDKKSLIRFDMSEFSERHTISRLIGSPPGYIGYDSGGELTNQIDQTPYSVLLLDEIEKASPMVFYLFLQILDDGHLTDNKGKRVDFSKTFVIFTSNIGNHEITKTMGFIETEVLPDFEEAVHSLFPVEFLNRLDRIVYFNSLNFENLENICLLKLNKMKDKLSQMDIKLSWDEELPAFIAKKSYDPLFGARALNRYLSVNIETPLSEIIHNNSTKRVKLLYKNDDISFLC